MKNAENMNCHNSDNIVHPSRSAVSSKDVFSKKIKNEKKYKKTRKSKKYKTCAGNWKIRIFLWFLLWIDLKNDLVETNEIFENIKTQDNTGCCLPKMNDRLNYNTEVKMLVKVRFLTTVLKLSSGSNYRFFISNKIRNQNKKMENGNGQLRQHVNLIQWNMGAKQWQRKFLEIEAVILQFTPDIFIVTEANMKMSLDEHEKNIAGYSMILPLSADIHGLARMVMLVRDGVETKILKKYMDDKVAAVWIRIGAAGRKPMNICGMYREHRFIYEGAPDDSGTDTNQNIRWYNFIESWKKVSNTGDTIVLGDLNLDFCKWSLPDARHSRMIEKVKDEIETLGFHQLVTQITRTWSGQPDTLIDHCWVNSPQRIIYVKNLVRSFSDHNLILVSFRTKNKIENKHKFFRRERRNFDIEKYRQDIQNIDWEPFFESEDLVFMNNFFTTHVLEILDGAAPLKLFQKRKNYRNWLNDEIKISLKSRDILREKARNSQCQNDWKTYRQARNQCVKKLKNCKNEYFKKLFKKVETEKTTKKLYNLAGELMGRNTIITPQQYLKEGTLIRKPAEMANLQMDFYVKKISDLMSKIKDEGRNPLRLLDAAINRWEDKDSVEVF